MGTQEAEEASTDAVRFSRREPGLGNRRDALWAAPLLALDSRGRSVPRRVRLASTARTKE